LLPLEGTDSPQTIRATGCTTIGPGVPIVNWILDRSGRRPEAA
jgi:hypothetical protein